jgi:copper chaperone NosL
VTARSPTGSPLPANHRIHAVAGNAEGIVAIYVSDMARSTNQDQPEVWVLAKQAWFVIGSRRRSGMDTPEAILFSEEAAARRFAAERMSAWC